MACSSTACLAAPRGTQHNTTVRCAAWHSAPPQARLRCVVYSPTPCSANRNAYDTTASLSSTARHTAQPPARQLRAYCTTARSCSTAACGVRHNACSAASRGARHNCMHGGTAWLTAPHCLAADRGGCTIPRSAPPRGELHVAIFGDASRCTAPTPRSAALRGVLRHLELGCAVWRCRTTRSAALRGVLRRVAYCATPCSATPRDVQSTISCLVAPRDVLPNTMLGCAAWCTATTSCSAAPFGVQHEPRST